MNMLLHGMKDTEFEIFHGDTLKNQWDVLNEMNPSKKTEFDAIVANPPFSLRWEPNDTLAEDFRFKSYGLAPKSAADFAFLLHGFHFLSNEGTMAIILPHGVLFRGGAEERIRTKLLKDNNIDAVIGLPSNLFYSTGIPVCIEQIRQNELRDGKKDGVYDKSEPNDIQSIIDTYKNRPEKIERYSRRVSMGEIEKNGYNLNISRYVSTAEDEVQIDLKEVNKSLTSINKRIDEKTKEHNKFLKDLGLKTI
jgi:type I restriction enzyme M protein